MKLFYRLLLLLVILAVIWIAFNTFRFDSRQISIAPAEKIEIPEGAIERMSQAIQIKTISNENPSDMDSAAFYAFKAFVKETYPLSDSLLEVTYINEFSIVMEWKGRDSALNPAIFMGHLDVVPVAEENIASWDADPFGGEIREGYIWGRGTIDDKISVMGNLEAIELLLKNGYQPERTMIFAFGHDEEIGGIYGAIAIVEHLKEKGVSAEFVIDEGFAISQGLVPGIDKDVALIGTAEKGFVSLELSLTMEGGHSSMPKPETAIDVLSRAVVALKENPFDTEITQPVKDFMAFAGPEMPFLQKMAFANPGIFEPLIVGTYEESPSGNALIRTTTSPTIIKAGLKENVIPYQARAIVNFRILPGTTIEDVKQHVKETIDDERIELREGTFSSEAPGISSTESFGFSVLNQTIKEIFPEVVTAPNLVVGATDSRHYTTLTNDIYRFTPFHLNAENITTFHGINERLSIEDYSNAIRFYVQLLKNTGDNKIETIASVEE